MNNKTYSKIRRKKSFASLILAFLLMLTFNASPIMMVANNIRNANAYKSSETKTYYASSKNDAETKFSDPNYPSSYKDYFNDSSKNFNLLTYYNTNFEKLYFKYADEFLRNCDIQVTVGTGGNEVTYTYNDEYLKFLEYYGSKTLSEFFTAQKNESLLKSKLKEVTPRALLEYLAKKGFTEYDGENTLPPVSVGIDSYPYENLSNFYRLFANYIVDGNIDSKPVDGEDSPNRDIANDEAFYKKPTLKDKEDGTPVGNSHYNRLVDFIDAEISKTAPIYAFDKESQDTNVAAIIANMVPTSVSYNYVSNSYVSYSEPSVNYRQYEDPETKVKTNVIYYFGTKTELEGFAPDFVSDNEAYLSYLSEGELLEGDIFLYRPIKSGEKGYLSGKTTYYKYTSSPYLTTSSKKDIYVLTDNSTTQDDLDTYGSVYFKPLTQTELNNNKEYYVEIPYGVPGNLFFKAAYNDLYSNKGIYGSDSDEKFNTFVNTFTTFDSQSQSRTSKLYVKVGTNTKKTVYIDESKYDDFVTNNAGYAYKVEKINTSTFNEVDYELILKNSNNSAYFVEGYDLYFEKTKEYYTQPATPTYDGTYETYYSPKIPLEMETVASTKYETEAGVRKIYIVSDSDDETLTIQSTHDVPVDYTFPIVKETVVSSNPDFYVEVPSYIYNDKKISDEYKLYYKHTATEAKKLYIVDNADDAENNKIYQTLNFNVISISELKTNITNYVAVKEGDANYNKNFQLYYKYDRDEVTSQIYVLKQPGIGLGSTQYKFVETSQLSDYSLINKEDNEVLYTNVKNAIELDDQNLEIELYYKLSGVFVQNTLKDGNAIYVLDTSVNKDEKETYTRLMYTPIGQKDIDNNPNLYVLIDSNDESNYFADYKLYYKYQTESTPSRVIYTYEQINKTAEDYHKENYELITDVTEYKDGDYVEGQELYYKKNILKTNTTNTTRPTFYYFQTTSTTTLSANSYYVVSFYVNTIGTDARASLGIKDTAKILDDINVNNISTNGNWEKYYVFISTNDNTASTINIYLYLGDEENGVKGNTSSDTITGSVFFDDIRITKIGLTDFTKYAIDDIAIYSESTLMKDSDGEPIADKYADKYNNRAIIANEDERFDSESWDSRKYLNLDAYNGNKWNDLFNFDNASLQNILGKDTGVEDELVENQIEEPALDLDGFKMYDSSFTSLWRYYISRDLANDFSIDNYINAYRDGKLEVSTTNKIAEPEEPEEDEEDEDKDEEESKEITYVSSPFNTNNYALRLKNSSRDTALGITSNSFTVSQFEYYKITLWIYSPDLEGKASISINSVLKDRQHPTYGSLLSASVSSVNANVENSTSSTSEYGWIPVSLYIEGNNFQEMECYLVLTAEKDSTVYFDNIRIEKTTSTQYDNAKSKSSSDKYVTALSLTPSSSLVSSDITNGTFDYIKEAEKNHDVTSDKPFEPDNWTALSTNSSRTVSGIVSLQQTAFFEKYSKDGSGNVIKPTEYSGDISNIFAIYSPEKVESLNDKVYTPAEIESNSTNLIDYKHTYSIYSASMSLSANSVYKISFKFFKNDNFNGKIISNIYNSAVKTANIISTMKVDESEFADEEWHTLTYYIATATSSSTVYLEIGVEEATGTCFFKSASAKKLTGKTIDSLIQSEASKAGIDSNSTVDLYNAFKTVRFLNLANTDLGYHSINVNSETEYYDPLSFTNKSDVTTEHTAGKIGVTVATYFDTINHTTYSTTINKVTYYIGEVYELEVDDVKYYIHRTYDSARNKYTYKMYSDFELKSKITKINNNEFEILTTGSVTVEINGVASPIETTTTYRLFKFADLREEVTEIDGADVSVKDLETVVVGEGAHSSENAITSKQNTSYVYHFGTSTKTDYEFNNNIISAKELENAQSANVMVLSNNHSTDYITVNQSTMRTLGKSTYNVLRIYVKTSDFEDENVGLNIKVSAVNVEWKNIDTTKSTQKDEYGFVCYEILVSSNSTDSISNFGVEFTLGNKNSSEVGYAIISKVSLDTISTKEEFEHYSAVVGDDNENIKKAIYADKASESKEETEEADDKNSISWATFFYVFSSILLVVTMAVALIAIFLKKHPIKTSEKFENEHDRDIQTVSSKAKKAPAETPAPRTTRAKKSKNTEVEIDLSVPEKSSKKDDGGIV